MQVLADTVVVMSARSIRAIAIIFVVFIMCLLVMFIVLFLLPHTISKSRAMSQAYDIT